MKGFKDGDPNIMVAPGAFQADTPDVPPQGDGISWDDKYAGLSLTFLPLLPYFWPQCNCESLGYRISETALQSINVLNVHSYSYATVGNEYLGVAPEYPTTNFKAFRNMLRWRDANCPSNEVLRKGRGEGEAAIGGDLSAFFSPSIGLVD